MECKRKGRPFEHAWALALKRHPVPRSMPHMHWGTLGKPRGRGVGCDETVLAFCYRAFRAAYEDEPVLVSALVDLNGIEAA
jgi:hypothetical protein